MTSPSTDPQPENTPGLEPGGGVDPGDTPPGEASTTGGVSAAEPDLPSAGANKAVYAVILGLTLVGALTFIGYAVGLLGG